MAQLINEEPALQMSGDECSAMKAATFKLLEYLNDLGLFKTDKKMLELALELKQTLMDTVGEYWMSSTAEDHWSEYKYDEWNFIEDTVYNEEE